MGIRESSIISPSAKGGSFNVLIRENSAAGAPEWHVSLDRIAGGSTLEQEAERLGISLSVLFKFLSDDPERYAAYEEAKQVRAEHLHERRIFHGLHMMDKADTYTKEQVAAKREGSKILDEAMKADNRDRFGAQVTHKHQAVPPDLKEWLTAIEQERRKAALEARTIDGEWAEESPASND